MASIINALSSGTGGIVTSGDASGILQLQTANTAAVTIDGSQNVGIGTASPGSGVRLDVLGGEIRAGRVDSSSEGGQVSFSRSTDNATAWYIDVYGNTSTPSLRFVDVGAGAVSVGINSSGAIALRGAASASGVGITFPSTQVASSNANTLDDYQEGSYTGTLTGCTTSPTTTVYYTKIGNVVHLNNLAAGITGTSNATTLRITGMPALIRPANTTKAAVQGGISGSVSQTIWVQVLSNGDLYCEQGGNAWPTSGVKGFDSGFGITYSTY